MLFGYFVNFGNSIIFFLSRLGEDAPLKFPYGVSIINDFIYLLSPHLYLLRLKLPLRLRHLRKGALPDGRLCSSRVYCLAHVLALPRTAQWCLRSFYHCSHRYMHARSDTDAKCTGGVHIDVGGRKEALHHLPSRKYTPLAFVS